jgi:hypothetical protein
MVENWQLAEMLQGVREFTEEAEERFTRLHVETMVALQIVLATGEFRPGRYRRSKAPSIDWQCDENSQ